MQNSTDWSLTLQEWGRINSKTNHVNVKQELFEMLTLNYRRKPRMKRCFGMMTRVTLIWDLVGEFDKALKFTLKAQKTAAFRSNPKAQQNVILCESPKWWKTCCCSFWRIYFSKFLFSMLRYKVLQLDFVKMDVSCNGFYK